MNIGINMEKLSTYPLNIPDDNLIYSKEVRATYSLKRDASSGPFFLCFKENGCHLLNILSPSESEVLSKVNSVIPFRLLDLCN